MSDDNSSSTVGGGVVQLKDMAHVLRHKASSELAVVCFGCFADPAQKQFAAAFTQVYALLGQTAKAAFGMIDVDECGQDLSAPFKLRAVPTTIFYRGAKESGRVENCDIDKLRKTMVAHMPLSPADLEAAVVKKYSETDTAALLTSAMATATAAAFKVTSAHFGDLNSGKTRDVTDRVRELLSGPLGVVAATKDDLQITDFDNAENNLLRVCIDRNGTGKVFTKKEGESLSTKQAGFQFTGHGTTHLGEDKVGFNDGRSNREGVIDDENDAFRDMSGGQNIANIPQSNCRR